MNRKAPLKHERLVVFALALGIAMQSWAASPIQKFLDKGRVTAFYGAAPSSDPLHMVDAIRRSGLAERMATLAGATLLLRRDLQVGFEACGRPEAFFSPDRGAIVICYEFVDLMAKTAAGDQHMMALPREQFSKLFDGALLSVYLHELGHAVVAINNVPVTGRAEDVADQFGAWFALNFLPLDRVPVIMPSLWLWGRLAQQRDLPSMSADQRRQFLANEHSLDEQRVYNIACMAAGARPDAAQSLITAVKMPAERAQRCPSEYAQVDYAMKKSFRKFFKVKPLRGTW